MDGDHFLEAVGMLGGEILALFVVPGNLVELILFITEVDEFPAVA